MTIRDFPCFSRGNSYRKEVKNHFLFYFFIAINRPFIGECSSGVFDVCLNDNDEAENSSKEKNQ